MFLQIFILEFLLIYMYGAPIGGIIYGIFIFLGGGELKIGIPIISLLFGTSIFSFFYIKRVSLSYEEFIEYWKKLGFTFVHEWRIGREKFLAKKGEIFLRGILFGCYEIITRDAYDYVGGLKGYGRFEFFLIPPAGPKNISLYFIHNNYDFVKDIINAVIYIRKVGDKIKIGCERGIPILFDKEASNLKTKIISFLKKNCNDIKFLDIGCLTFSKEVCCIRTGPPDLKFKKYAKENIPNVILFVERFKAFLDGEPQSLKEFSNLSPGDQIKCMEFQLQISENKKYSKISLEEIAKNKLYEYSLLNPTLWKKLKKIRMEEE